jgi:hypothetical protein
MNQTRFEARTGCRMAGRLIAAFLVMGATASAADLDMMGLILLRAATTNLDGSGVRVAQIEALANSNMPPPFEVNPAVVALPVDKFAYFTGPPTAATPASSSTFPNALGSASGHAGAVGSYFYGMAGGMSTNIQHVDNYEANYFFFTVVPGLTAIDDRIVNQSFISPGSTNGQRQIYDSNYDNYAAQYNTLFISGIGNGGAVNSPSTCYNGIGVGAYGGASSTGPTPDNGRSKPDIVAPAAVTSYSTPRVSGSAAILLQAGLRGDGGADTNAAVDARVLKALLLNGAIKPANWLNPSPSPFDPRYGSGVLNVFNSYNQLAGGKNGYIESGSVSIGGDHPPLGATGNVNSLSGWDLNTSSSTVLSDGINHYYFDLRAASGDAAYTATATLVWNRQAFQTGINNLDFYLYDAVSGNLMGASTSVVDNVEHLHIPRLPQGRYDLQVLKRGGTVVSLSETYALAFEFFAVPLNIVPSERGVVLTWPDYPAGFVLQSAPSLNEPVTWNPVDLTPVVTNRHNVVEISPPDGNQFFRLRRP